MSREGATTELVLTLDRDRPLGAQIESGLRRAIRTGVLRAGAAMPSTRDLARQLNVSRGLVVNAYAQLAAEGFVLNRQGTRPRVSGDIQPATAPNDDVARHDVPRFDFRPAIPDVSRFPREAWLKAVRLALQQMTVEQLSYEDVNGVHELRAQLCDYLGRSRQVVATPGRTTITSGYLQSSTIVCNALAGRGVRTVALEHPGTPREREVVRRAGLTPILIDVDQHGMRIDDLVRSDAQAVLLTPAHQFPTGVALSGERRNQLIAWLRATDAIAVEDDYDAEYRYDKAAVGALQGLAPDHVVYCGSASKTLAPAIRIGWLIAPPDLHPLIERERSFADRGTSHIEQHALATFIARGELDRHLRRMRSSYRARRDTLIKAIAEQLPQAVVTDMSAGLHACVVLPDGVDESSIQARAAEQRIAFDVLGQYCRDADSPGPPTLLLGYGAIAEPTIRPGIAALAAVLATVLADHR